MAMMNSLSKAKLAQCATKPVLSAWLEIVTKDVLVAKQPPKSFGKNIRLLMVKAWESVLIVVKLSKDFIFRHQ